MAAQQAQVVGRELNTNVIQPTAQKLQDPNLRQNISTTFSSITKSVAETGERGFNMVQGAIAGQQGYTGRNTGGGHTLGPDGEHQFDDMMADGGSEEQLDSAGASPATTAAARGNAGWAAPATVSAPYSPPKPVMATPAVQQATALGASPSKSAPLAIPMLAPPPRTPSPSAGVLAAPSKSASPVPMPATLSAPAAVMGSPTKQPAAGGWAVEEEEWGKF